MARCPSSTVTWWTVRVARCGTSTVSCQTSGPHGPVAQSRSSQSAGDPHDPTKRNPRQPNGGDARRNSWRILTPRDDHRTRTRSRRTGRSRTTVNRTGPGMAEMLPGAEASPASSHTAAWTDQESRTPDRWASSCSSGHCARLLGVAIGPEQVCRGPLSQMARQRLSSVRRLSPGPRRSCRYRPACKRARTSDQTSTGSRSAMKVGRGCDAANGVASGFSIEL